MISVIIPLYNKKKTIARCIESILDQSYKDLEIIAVDDGSTDGGAEEAEKFGGKIKVIKGLGHFGANWARNYGAHLAQGEYLFFCDADIVLKSRALKELKNALDKNSKCSYAYCSFRRGWKKMPSRPFDAGELRKQSYISAICLMRRKDFPGFDEGLKRFQDWDLYLTMLEQGKTGVFVPQTLFRSYVDRYGISGWLPKFFYKIPWKRWGIKFDAIERYEKARAIIVKKHGL